MKRLLILFFILFCSHLLISQRINNSESSTTSINIIVIGAHPDDCDIRFGGTAALLSKMGHKIKFLSVTSFSTPITDVEPGTINRIVLPV